MEKIKCDIIILVVSSRGEIYDKLINNYWNNLIKFIKKCELSVKIIMIFGHYHMIHIFIHVGIGIILII
jgi:hypothetical protein